MDREGILFIAKLNNVARKGTMPKLVLVPCCSAYYRKRTVGYNRLYAAMGANKEISLLVRCFNTEVPDYSEQLYVVFEKPLELSNNGEAEIIHIGDNNRRYEQFRVTAIQEIVEEGAIDLTLSKIENYYDVDFGEEFPSYENGHSNGGPEIR